MTFNFYITFIFFNSSLVFQDRDEQRRLEMKHRKEEDDLYRKFARQREEEERRIKEEIRVSVFRLCIYILRQYLRPSMYIQTYV